jgi:ubiquinone/menaquinone biosynthesis C-methylase UbiE
MNKLLYFFLLVLTSVFFSCKQVTIPSPVIADNKADDLTMDKFDDAFKPNKGRDVWQRPGEILDLLGDIKGKTVADIGAGTGFFSFRLLFRDANVIAIDINPQMLEIIDDFKLNLDEGHRDHLQTRLALPSDSKLVKDEAEIIIIINTIGFIENRVNYLKHLYELLPKNGKIMIVDFKRKSLPIDASPIENRVPLFELEHDFEDVGLKVIESKDNMLDYQYVLIGQK